jgi:polyisoprenoid-binding protein YceI
MGNRTNVRAAAVAASVAVLLMVGVAAAERYAIDAVHSAVGFSIRHLVSRASGNFTQFAGTIDYDPAAPESTRVQAVIQVASIDTRNQDRDRHLRSGDFFAADTYPEITFASTGARLSGDTLQVAGNLTMRGITKSLVLPVEVLGLGTHPATGAPVAGFSSTVVVKRSDFGLNSWTDAAGVLGDEVTAELSIEAAGPAAGR